jgi:AAA+ superfamily predicted ATPase
MYDRSFAAMKEFVEDSEPFFCKDIKEVLKEKDALLKKIKENEEKAQKERAEYVAAEEKKH